MPSDDSAALWLGHRFGRREEIPVPPRALRQRSILLSRGTFVKTAGWIAPGLVLFVGLGSVSANNLPRPLELERINRRLAGQVLDFTNKLTGNLLIRSEALG